LAVLVGGILGEASGIMLLAHIVLPFDTSNCNSDCTRHLFYFRLMNILGSMGDEDSGTARDGRFGTRDTSPLPQLDYRLHRKFKGNLNIEPAFSGCIIVVQVYTRNLNGPHGEAYILACDQTCIAILILCSGERKSGKCDFNYHVRRIASVDCAEIKFGLCFKTLLSTGFNS